MRRGKKRHEKVTKKRNKNIHYEQRIHVFNYLSKNNQDIKDFEDLIINDWKTLIGFIEDSGNIINVGENDIRSMTNPGGAYKDIVYDLSTSFDTKSSNNSTFRDSHEAAILTIIAHESRNLKALLTRLRKYLLQLQVSNYRWNVVYYTDYEERGTNL